jgi:hypothetical protein
MPRGAKPKIYPSDLVRSVRDLYGQGHSQEEVAVLIGLRQQVVSRLMRRAGIPRRPQIKRDQRGARNSSWKGTAATYAAAHYRVYALRGQPSHCEECGSTDPARRYQWASISKNYADPYDYRRLCASCHSRFDYVIRNLGAYAVRKELPTS